MDNNPQPKVNLLDFNRQQMQDYFLSIGEKPYRATQILQWIHQHSVDDFDAMTNLSKSLRRSLSDICDMRVPEIASEQASKDGTRKWLLRLADGNCIETVFIPEETRGTLCVSSQVGCALNCSFCSTATQGFNRNLSTAEIIGQVWVAKKRLAEDAMANDRIISNVVMMGMGEPLLNFDNVVAAMDIMMDDFGYGLSKRRVTLSTSGVIPAMEKLSEASDCALAVSLHAPNDELRNILVPINKKYPIKQLMAVCRDYFKRDPRRVVTFEYVMLNGVNDSITHAKQLINILQNVPCKMNLIPFNPYPGSPYTTSPEKVINAFRDKLMSAGIMTMTRKTRGDDIDAACGQLVGNITDRTKRSQRKRVIPILPVANQDLKEQVQ